MANSSVSEKIAKLPKPGTVREKLYYLKLSLFHPFEGFYDIRFRGKGSLVIAFIILAIYGMVECAAYQYTGFILNLNNIYKMNSVSIFLSHTLIIGLFCVSNWSVTTLLNGEGKYHEIFMVTMYALYPYCVLRVIALILSNFLLLDEMAIVSAIKGIGVALLAFYLFIGLVVIHEYSFTQGVAVVFLTLFAILVIVFVPMLAFSLTADVWDFLRTVWREARLKM